MKNGKQSKFYEIYLNKKTKLISFEIANISLMNFFSDTIIASKKITQFLNILIF